MPKQIVGNVYWIQGGKATSRIADVKEAFGDPHQAKAQILYAESSGDKRQLRLARLAFREFQGKRYRLENKTAPKRTTVIKEQEISRPSRKEPARARSRKGRAVGRRKATKKPSQLLVKPRKAPPSKKPTRKMVEKRSAVKVASKPSKGRPLAKASRKLQGRKSARRATKLSR